MRHIRTTSRRRVKSATTVRLFGRTSGAGPLRADAGFTLIEILVVIGIIIFLVAISVTVMGNMVATAREKATRATIKKVNELLIQRMDAFERVLAERKIGNSTLAEVKLRKRLFRKHFPQVFDDTSEDLNGNGGNPDFGEDTNDNNVLDLRADVFLGKTGGDATESAECLFYFLTQAEAFGVDVDVTDAFGSNAVADTDGDGLMEFVDAWRNPLRFYRWPTRLFRPDTTVTTTDTDVEDPQTIVDDNEPENDRKYRFPINTRYAELLYGSIPVAPVGVSRRSSATFFDEQQDPLAQDGDDPQGLTHPATSSAARFFEVGRTTAPVIPAMHTPDTYHVPLIVSAGQDGELGLFEPNDTPNFGRLAQPDPAKEADLTDNITSQNLAAGGN